MPSNPKALIFLLCLAPLAAQADTSNPTGQWYLNANHYNLSALISNTSPGHYTGTLINENGGGETLDNISWNAATRTMQFRRDGAGFYQWYYGTVVEGVFAGRFSSASTPAQPTLASYAWHVTAWNSTYLDTSLFPRVWELQIGRNQRARLRIDQTAPTAACKPPCISNVGQLKVYATVSGGAAGEQLEYDLGSVKWDGTNLSFVQHVGTTVRTYTATASGRTLSGSYLPGGVVFGGTRAEVLTHGTTPKNPPGTAQWAQRTRSQLFHLTMGDNPQPLTTDVTVLGTNLAPTPSFSLPPDRDDNPSAWPQNYTMTEIQFNYTLPNPYGGAPIARTSHGYLSVPTTPPPPGGKYRALLAVNGHGGSGWAMMNPDDEYFWYGDSYARRGYVVLALDISHRPLVDRSSLYTDYTDGDDPSHGNGTHPAVKAAGFDSDWEEDGERGWDAMRGMDYLLSLPNVDGARVVVSGISMGGEVTGITGGLDTRLAMSVVAGYSPDEGVMFYYGNHPCWQWQHGDIREYVDVSDYLALTAPRPLLVETGQVDFTFSGRNPPFSADKQELRRVMAAYGPAPAQCNMYLHYDQHHYHVGDVNPTSPTPQGVLTPKQVAPSKAWSLVWQTNAATKVLQPTLFDAITFFVP